ncbi:hypothetical protein PRIPAC_78695, partial [Pristionchus pacificus]
MEKFQLTSTRSFLLSSSISLISLHFLLSFSLFEYTNTLYLGLSAVYCLVNHFTSPSKATPAFLISRRVLLSCSLLALSLLLSYESYDIGRFHRWQCILFSLPLLSDSRSRSFTISAAISAFLSFHFISNENNSMNTPLFVPLLSSDFRSIIACFSLIYATVLLSRDKLEPGTLCHSFFSILLISTVMRELVWPEIRPVSIFYQVFGFPIIPILAIIVSVPISIRSYGHQLIATEHSLSHVFIVFFISRLILLLVSRMHLILSGEATFLSSLPS